MTVAELIALLQTQDPNAVVLMPETEDTEFCTDNERLEGIETGFCDDVAGYGHHMEGVANTKEWLIETSISFSMRDFTYSRPAVRLLGCCTEKTNPLKGFAVVEDLNLQS